MHGAEYGHAAVCTVLLEKGADVNAKDNVRGLKRCRGGASLTERA